MPEEEVPVSEGEQLEVTIEAIGEKGDGIAKVDGFVLFVPDTQRGDTVTIEVTKVLENMGFAERVSSDSGSSEDEPEEGIQIDEESGKEKIVGESLEAEYDPSKESEEFG